MMRTTAGMGLTKDVGEEAWCACTAGLRFGEEEM